MSTNFQPQRILLIRPSALGDVCRSVPVLASLRKAWPDARIDWVVQDTFLPAIESHPALTNAIIFPRARFSHWWRSPRIAREMFRWFSDIRSNHYDLVLDCQGLFRSALITRSSGARDRVGLRSARELAWLSYTQRVSPPDSPHSVDQMMALIEHLQIELVHDMKLFVSETNRNWWAQKSKEGGFHDDPYAVLATTSRWASKRWPGERFAGLLEPILQRGFSRIILIGAPGEEPQTLEFLSACKKPDDRLIDLTGKTTIGQIMAVIASSSLVVANDSAPLHMAVGFEKPCIALFGPTEPDIVGPYRRPESVIRGYQPSVGNRVHFKDPGLGDSLMRLISIDMVLERLDEILSSAAQIEPPPKLSPDFSPP